MRIERVDIENCGGVSAIFRFPSRGLALGAAPNDGGKTVLIAAIAAALYGESDLRPFASLPEGEAGPSKEGSWVMLHLVLDSGESLAVARDLAAGSVQITDSAGNDVSSLYRGASASQELGEVMLGLTREEFEDTVVVSLQNLRDVFGNPQLTALLDRDEETETKDGSDAETPGDAPPDATTSDDAPADATTADEVETDTPSDDAPADEVETDTPSDDAPEVATSDAGEEFAGDEELPAADPTSETTTATPTTAEEDDAAVGELNIVRSTSVEFGLLAGDQDSASLDSADGGDAASEGSLAGREEADPDDADATDPAKPLHGPAAEIHRLKRDLERLNREFARKSEELRQHSERTQELRGSLDRVGAIAGSEPHDLERLGQLVELMRKAQERELRLGQDEADFRREIGEKGMRPERLEELQRSFAELDPADREFLDGYRQADTIRRGNHALIKSESRLDETRLTEIERAREEEARMAVVPLSVAALSLGASVLLHFFSVSFLSPQALIILAVLMAVGSFIMLRRAKSLRETERVKIFDSLEHKRVQLAEFEKEERYNAGRLTVIGEACEISDARKLLARYDEWKERQSEFRRLESFTRRRRELEEEMGTIREKLGSFSPNENGGASTLGSAVGDWEILYREYQQTFEAREELENADETAAQLESELTALEADRASVADAIAELLVSVGLPADKDPDEAIEALGLRDPQLTVARPADADAVRRVDIAPPRPPRDPSLPAAWQAPLSARVEAIVRRFLPSVRDIEIDGRLVPSLRLTPDGGRLGLSELTSRLSAASLDQLCLALRLAIVENLSSHGETLPVLLDDPLIRADDARHDRALEFLVEDASNRYQVVLLTCHEVRARWFLHQHPQLRETISSITSNDEAEGAAPVSGIAWAALSSPS